VRRKKINFLNTDCAVDSDKRSVRIGVIRIQKLLLILRKKNYLKNLLVRRLIKADKQRPAFAVVNFINIFDDVKRFFLRNLI
jgi:hypothetical protein